MNANRRAIYPFIGDPSCQHFTVQVGLHFLQLLIFEWEKNYFKLTIIFRWRI